jgi:SAM domain (Sterile alpha motif)
MLIQDRRGYRGLAPGTWLHEYERAVLDNAIDADILPTLTADDLKDLGVTAVD